MNDFIFLKKTTHDQINIDNTASSLRFIYFCSLQTLNFVQGNALLAAAALHEAAVSLKGNFNVFN